MKVNEVVTEQKLCNLYDRYAVPVLISYLTPVERKRGQRCKFIIAKELPDKDEYAKLLTAKYRTPVGDLITDAFSEFESLAGEMRDWYDNLPESFQNGDKGDQLQQAADTLENLQAPDEIEDLAGFSVVFKPCLKLTSRGKMR